MKYSNFYIATLLFSDIIYVTNNFRAHLIFANIVVKIFCDIRVRVGLGIVGFQSNVPCNGSA